ncbi:hypothetical protein ACVWYF_003593 [Hymenobacter sp. UYAg731]
MADSTKTVAKTTTSTLAVTKLVPTTTTDFNITLQLGDNVENVVTLYASDLAKVAERGITFELPAGTSITLGTLKSLLAWFNNKIDPNSDTIPTEASESWPDAIKEIFNGVLNVETAVTQFRFRQDPKDAAGVYPAPEFKLALTGTAMDPKNPKVRKPIRFGEIFSVVGGGIGIERTNTTVVVVE